MYAEHILNHVELGSLSSALLPRHQYSDSGLKGKRSEKRNSSFDGKDRDDVFILVQTSGSIFIQTWRGGILQSRGRTPPTVGTSYDRGPSATLRSHSALPGVGFGILEKNKAFAKV